MRTKPIVLTPGQAAAHKNPARISVLSRSGHRYICDECHVYLNENQIERHDCVLDCGLYVLPAKRG